MFSLPSPDIPEELPNIQSALDMMWFIGYPEGKIKVTVDEKWLKLKPYKCHPTKTKSNTGVITNAMISYILVNSQILQDYLKKSSQSDTLKGTSKHNHSNTSNDVGRKLLGSSIHYQNMTKVMKRMMKQKLGHYCQGHHMDPSGKEGNNYDKDDNENSEDDHTRDLDAGNEKIPKKDTFVSSSVSKLANSNTSSGSGKSQTPKDKTEILISGKLAKMVVVVAEAILPKEFVTNDIFAKVIECLNTWKITRESKKKTIQRQRKRKTREICTKVGIFEKVSGTSSFKVPKDGSAFKDKEPHQQSFEIVKTEDEDFNTTPNIPPQHLAMDISTPIMSAGTTIGKKIKELCHTLKIH
ncbi:hypothetical protein QVD17_06889 [Tagetes erecta]|uniref:Uncharacterized protein n=1 Tax=Tagetes erecta TaxID=13708 RepID=A0AAD8LK98_TARER|nr:hypothetical protein QVD17_06889 [Tagetes erecta]